MKIKNRSFFSNAEFLPAENYKFIGECAGKKVVLIGRSKVYGDPIVALCQSDDPSQEDLAAWDLYELMKISNETIKLTAPVFA